MNGACNNDIGGDGTCRYCNDDYYGIDCDKHCNCTQGICFFGTTGDGACLTCFQNYAIYNGSCNECPVNVTCTGISTPVISNNSALLGNIFFSSLNVSHSKLVLNNFELVGDLWTSSSIYSFSNSTTITGNADFYDTGLFLGGSNLYVNGNLLLVGGTATIGNNSIITVTQCVTITNTTFIVNDLDLLDKDVFTIILSDPSCSNITNVNLVVNSQSSCKQVTGTKTLAEKGLSFEVTFDTSACTAKTNSVTSQPWFIGTIAIVCLIAVVILIIAVIFTVPSLREVIFPYREKPPDYQTTSPADRTFYA